MKNRLLGDFSICLSIVFPQCIAWSPATSAKVYMSHFNTADFLIIGAGIVGLCLARELKRRYPDQHVIVLEKEASAG
ncbi:FAD-dependent oxidoreductase, partial [uncultured Thiodictyon sp.]|uniref:FAD-dependent oxidoreductase n=1 Tax=uncultured Thiodictyon sp. TaxID=1846217 RepID=UPI0025E681FF